MSKELEKDEMGITYVAISIGKIEPDKELSDAIYLKIDHKFIKFKYAGDCIEAEKINYFIQKNVKSIYVKEDDFDSFNRWLFDKKEEAVEEIVKQVGQEHREVVEKNELIRERVYDTFTSLELDSGIVDILKDEVAEFISEVKGIDISKAVLAKMLRHSSSTVDHALNVANISLYMALVLGIGAYQELEDIYMGALFHDYSKMKISSEVMSNEQSFQYKKAINDHPKNSSMAVAKFDGIRKEVHKIIEQHHEHHNGNGYPQKLKGKEIFELAQIVAIGNAFDNVVVENRNRPNKEKYRVAIKTLEYDKGKQFNSDLVDKLIMALKLAYGDYYVSPTGS